VPANREPTTSTPPSADPSKQKSLAPDALVLGDGF